MNLLKKILNRPEIPEPAPSEPPKPQVHVTLRPADIHDILALSLMWTKMTEEIFADFIKIDKEELDRFAFAMADRLRMPNVFTQIAEIGAKPVGFIHGYIQERPYGKPHKIAFCECLYIEPDWRGKGIKNSLVDSFISWGEEKEAAIEFITRYDPDLAKIWERSNFRPYGIVLRR